MGGSGERARRPCQASMRTPCAGEFGGEGGFQAFGGEIGAIGGDHRLRAEAAKAAQPSMRATPPMGAVRPSEGRRGGGVDGGAEQARGRG